MVILQFIPLGFISTLSERRRAILAWAVLAVCLAALLIVVCFIFFSQAANSEDRVIEENPMSQTGLYPTGIPVKAEASPPQVEKSLVSAGDGNEPTVTVTTS